MILSNFLSRQKHDDSNPHESIPISFKMQCILQERYYNIRKEGLGKYLFQTRSQANHGVGKILDPNIQPEKQVIKPITVTNVEFTQVKPRLGQGRAGLRCKIKTPVSRPIVQTIEKPLKSLEQLGSKTKP